ncbi:LLM class flavin-dependent oxidoreductase [Microbacterium sp. NEAU-LLC]|uniref:LLM class flavin-dependent oxidoreductase n=1 Tax=Microbacterium helvum TaxID=2773713 RepID=A0ABR8NMI6_9MICO|nr:LLM class flavin-dependent oxidoreductase [Microbacterium helvum]MBD3941875.1 LLM class flavin-dependent oxidoreductase [Microbacterium helvum]
MTSFRFGVVTGAHGDARAWSETARRVEGDGYAALLVPDTLYTPSPFLALSVAAAATSTLRLGTWVLAAPLRSPAATVRETRTLVELSGGRFELGLGAGRPQGEADAAALGVPWGSGRERVDQVEATIAAVRGALGDDLPLTLAAGGDRMMRIAGRHAQAVALPLPPHAHLAAVTAVAARARAAAAPDRPPIELSLQIAGVGEAVPEWLRRSAGLTPESLRAAGAVAALSGDVTHDAEALRALRDATGVSFFTVPDELAPAVAPLVAELAGR